jgi:hypothetical protein
MTLLSKRRNRSKQLLQRRDSTKWRKISLKVAYLLCSMNYPNSLLLSGQYPPHRSDRSRSDLYQTVPLRSDPYQTVPHLSDLYQTIPYLSGSLVQSDCNTKIVYTRFQLPADFHWFDFRFLQGFRQHLNIVYQSHTDMRMLPILPAQPATFRVESTTDVHHLAVMDREMHWKRHQSNDRTRYTID